MADEASHRVGEKKARKRKKGLYRKLVQQLEFYFSDANMTKSKFMQQATENDPWVPISTFLKFNKISKLLAEFGCEDPLKELTKSLEVVKSDLLEYGEGRVRRVTPVTTKDNEDEYTIYVENVGQEVDHDHLKKMFNEYGRVVYVSIPKFRGAGVNKGFAFVEFDEIESAKKALDAFGHDSNVLNKDMEPGDLLSVKSFNEENEQLKENVANVVEEEEDTESRKRKTESDESVLTKKAKVDNEENLTENKSKKKKKARIRKESGMDSTVISECATSGLKILSKVEWKKLRNQYLNLQRKNMKLAKSKLRKQAYQRGPGRPGQSKYKESNDHEQLAGDKDSKDTSKDGQNSAFTIKPNLIVKISFEDGVDDVKKLKRNIQELLAGESVGYVDAKVGNKVAYVRCKEEEQADKLVCAGKQYERLQGDEESKYWEKIQQDRSDKRGGKVKLPKEKKKNKIIREIETAKAAHIYFPE